MKVAHNTGSQGSSIRRNALLWLLLVLIVALNCRLILRGLFRGGDRALPILGGRDYPGSVNDPSNDILSDRRQVDGVIDPGGTRRGGVLGEDFQQGRGPPLSRGSRKEGGDSTVGLAQDVSGGWEASAKRLEADKKGECLFTSNSNSPGVPDLYGYVEAYWDSMVNMRMFNTLEEASKMQAWTTVADMRMEDAVHVITEDSLRVRLRFLEGLHASTGYTRRKTKVAIVTTISNDVGSLERRVFPWMQYHVDMGVAQFYVFYDGDDPKAVEALGLLPFVCVLTAKPELGADDGVRMRYAMHMSQTHMFSSSVGDVQKSNELLMTKQTFGMNEGVRAGRADGMDWLLHIDTDELFVPEAHASIPQAFEAVDATDPTIRVLNLEAQLEAGDVTSPFLQVTLFRNHQYFTTKESQHYRSTFKQGVNTGWLYLYTNGKSAVRLDNKTAPAAHGPHYWKPSPNTDGEVRDRWKNRISNSSVILHYAYSNPDELVSKAARSCPQYWGKEVDLDEVMKECFVLGVDARAFVAANRGKEAAEQFFYENFVYSEGAPTQCRTYGVLGRSGWCTMTDMADLKELMVRMELMRRFTLPQVILQRHEHELQMLLVPNMISDGEQSFYN